MNCPHGGECRMPRVRRVKGRGAVPDTCKMFRCSKCRAYVPECFGCDDDHPLRCDACVAEESQ